jgi:hypothetical protein
MSVGVKVEQWVVLKDEKLAVPKGLSTVRSMVERRAAMKASKVKMMVALMGH